MNSFARYLFQGLFSWVYGAVIHLSDPALIDSWLAVHWLQVLIVILLFGTLIDVLVWLLRWRPDLVWRSGAHHVSGLLDPEERQMRRFRKDRYPTADQRRREDRKSGSVHLPGCC